MKYLNYSTLLFALCICQWGLSQFHNVNWVDLSNAQFNGSKLSMASPGKSTATSTVILFGDAHKMSKNVEGTVRYVIEGNDDPKALGFSTIEGRQQRFSDLKYALVFQKNMKATVRVEQDNKAQVSFVVGDVFSITRTSNSIQFFKNSTLLYEENVDIFEDLLLNAFLQGNNAKFTNVQTNYLTTRLGVTFDVDNVNNKIDYTISGGVPPYDAVWGDYRTRSQSYEPNRKGTYQLKITDAQKNTISRQISIGTDVFWQDFHRTSQLEKSLYRLNGWGNSWGTAASQASITENSNWWVEYDVELEANSKFFGISKSTSTPITLSDIIIGFFVSDTKDRTLKIIENGEVITKNPIRDHDVLRFEKQEGALLCYYNDVVIHKAEYTLQNSTLKIIGAVRPNSTLKNLRFLSDEPEMIVTSFNSTTNKGNIHVSLPNDTKIGPYYYYVSETPLPNLDVIHNYLIDSLEIGIDSIFFTPNSNLKTYTFYDLPMGNHFVSVFDSAGELIFGQEVRLTPQIKYSRNSGIEQIGDLLVSNSDDAIGEFLLFARESTDNSRFGFVFSNETIKQFMGYAVDSVSVSNELDLLHGFVFENSRAQTITDGVLSTETYFVRRNSELILEQKNGRLNYLIDGRVVKSVILPTTFIYKSVLGMRKGGLVVKPLISLLKPFNYSHTLEVTHGTCDDVNGAITFQITPRLHPLLNFVGMNHYLYDENMNQVGVQNQTVFNNVSPGFYIIQGSINYTFLFMSISIPIYINVVVGVEGDWQNEVAIDFTPNTNSLTKASGVIPINEYARADALNKLNPSTAGWVFFEPKINSNLGVVSTNINSAANYNATIDFTNPPNTSIIKLNLPPFFVLHALLYNSGSSTYFEPVQNGDKIRLNRLANGAIELKKNFSSTPFYTDNTGYSGSLSSIVHVLSENDAMLNYLFSFGCPSPQIVYSRLKRKLDAGYYLSIDNKVYVEYDEEYDDLDSELTYRILVDDGTEYYPPSLAPVQIVKIGDNRLEFEVDNFPSGFYILEITNEKNETLKLRFKV